MGDNPEPLGDAGATGEARGDRDGIGLAVVIPAGPNDDVADTLASVLHYTHGPRVVVVIDDTRADVAAQLRAMSPDVRVIPPASNRPGLYGHLWWNLANGFAHARDALSFDVLLRLDADALLTGHGIAELAAARLERDPGVGMLGSSRIGMDGGQRDLSWPAAALDRECGLRGLDRPEMRRVLQQLRDAARRHGYVPGEHALGGAYVLSPAAVDTWMRKGWLSLSALSRSHLGEDHLFGLLVLAAGLRIAEFAGPNDPMALDLRRLPGAPDELLAAGKVVVHSVRGWGDMGEAEVRGFFAAARASDGRPTT